MDSSNFVNGRQIYASEVNTLMGLINAECARRNRNNPPSGSDWTNVGNGSIVKKEEINKLYTPIKNINNSAPSIGTYISLANLWTWYEYVHGGNETYEQSGSRCSGTCTGFCTSCWSTCSGSCTSCTGCTSCSSCSGCSGCTSCTGDCHGSCDTCGGGCGLDCSGGCKQGCRYNPGCSGQ